MIAYEPVWAIGTGDAATPDDAQAAAAQIRGILHEADPDGAHEVPILYGGSCTPQNAPDLFAQPDVDGALVGGASLDAGSFAAIVRAAAEQPAMTDRPPRPVVLCVLDGFGIGDDPRRNALLAARMPAWHALTADWPTCRLEASGEAVGLPAGQMGNSEVGHLNLGAGFPVMQDLPRINRAIADGSFFRTRSCAAAVEHAEARRRGAPPAGARSGPGGSTPWTSTSWPWSSWRIGPACHRIGCCCMPSPMVVTRRHARPPP